MTNEEVKAHMDMLIAHKDKALETHPYFKRCDSCIHSEERDGSNCYECIKGMADNFEAQPTDMRDATEEERKSVKDYVDSVSKPTGVNFNELLRDCGTCKHNTGIDCGQYPCNECNRRTHPLYEPKIAQPTDMTIDEAIEDCEENDYGQIADWLRELKAYKEAQPTDEIKEAYLKGYDYGVKDWFKSKTQPSEDCVSRVEAINVVHKYFVDYLKLNDDICLDGIRSLPSVTPQRPKGKWNFIGDQMFECSSCKRTYTQNQFEELRIYTTDDLLPKFCPNCGVDMSGGGEDEVSD